MGKKGGSSPKMPAPIDPGKSMGEYLFGKSFTQYSGITDPRLQQRLLEAEGRYRPQYSALELADINTMWEGFEDVTTSPQYQSLQAELAGLEAGASVSNLTTGDRRAALGEQYDALRPSGDPKSFGGKKGRGGRGFGKDSTAMVKYLAAKKARTEKRQEAKIPGKHIFELVWLEAKTEKLVLLKLKLVWVKWRSRRVSRATRAYWLMLQGNQVCLSVRCLDSNVKTM